MSLRMKSLFVAFGISIALWGVMIKSASAIYATGSGALQTDAQWTASLDHPVGFTAIRID